MVSASGPMAAMLCARWMLRWAFGSLAGRLGDRAHLGGRVDRIEYERGIPGRRIGERGDDQGALGPEGLEQGIDDGFRSALDEADAAEGAVDHEEVAGADAELIRSRTRSGRRSGAQQAPPVLLSGVRGTGRSCCVRIYPAGRLTCETGRAWAMVAFTRGSINDVCGN